MSISFFNKYVNIDNRSVSSHKWSCANILVVPVSVSVSSSCDVDKNKTNKQKMLPTSRFPAIYFTWLYVPLLGHCYPSVVLLPELTESCDPQECVLLLIILSPWKIHFKEFEWVWPLQPWIYPMVITRGKLFFLQVSFSKENLRFDLLRSCAVTFRNTMPWLLSVRPQKCLCGRSKNP